MIDRFIGESGRRLRIEAMQTQRLVGGDAQLAAELAEMVELISIEAGVTIIEQEAEDNDIYFIIRGVFDVIVNATRVRQRGPGDSVGEMAAVEPIQRRSATVTATEKAIVAKLSEAKLTEIAAKYPDIWRRMAKVLSQRLMERNQLVVSKREKIRVFVISSAENMGIVQQLQNQFSHDPFLTIPWNQGVFKVASYTIEDIEKELDQCDFAIAIAHGDDQTTSRGSDWPAPRDNVIFELGLFMGRLGRSRAILMEPQGERLKLPSDIAGIKAVRYVYDPKNDTAAKFAPACNELREHIMKLGCLGQS